MRAGFHAALRRRAVGLLRSYMRTVGLLRQLGQLLREEGWGEEKEEEESSAPYGMGTDAAGAGGLRVSAPGVRMSLASLRATCRRLRALYTPYNLQLLMYGAMVRDERADLATVRAVLRQVCG